MSETADSDALDFSFPAGITTPEELMLNYTSPYGVTSITFGDIDEYYHHKLQLAIVFGVRIGLAFMTFFAINLISKNRKTPIYVLNQMVLVCLFLHSILYAFTLGSEYGSMGYYFNLYDYSDDYSRNLLVATNCFYLLLIISVQASITYQVFIIFKDPFKNLRWLQYVAVAASVLLSLATVGVYFSYIAISNKQAFNPNVFVPDWMASVSNILFASSSFVVSVMTTVKLGYSLQKRKFLGLKQFSIFHILFIMGSQTMIIPTILMFVAFVQFSSDNTSFQALSNIASGLIAISLPATSMWANSSVSEAIPTSSNDTYLSRDSSNTSYGNSSFTMAKSYFSDNKNNFDDMVHDLDSPTTIIDEQDSISQNHHGNYVWKDISRLAKDLEPTDLDEDFDDDKYLSEQVDQQSKQESKSMN